jgi:hypothetical protein
MYSSGKREAQQFMRLGGIRKAQRPWFGNHGLEMKGLRVAQRVRDKIILD